MDKWSDEQLNKMKVCALGLAFWESLADYEQTGGNEKFKDFMENYGPEGGYTKGMGMQEKYNSWAAAQYREKVSNFFILLAVSRLIHLVAHR